MNITKRDGSVVPFDATKIVNAVFKALSASGCPSDFVAECISKDVLESIKDQDSITVEQMQDLVEKALMKRGLHAAAKAYILYRDQRSRDRAALKIRREKGREQSITDRSMLIVQAISNDVTSEWDRSKIVAHLAANTDIGELEAKAVAKEVENRIIASGLQIVNTGFVREMVNNVLRDKGFSSQLSDLDTYKVPKEFIDGLMHEKVNENSNIVSNNPEAVSLAISELVLKQYALDTVYSPEVKMAHVKGMVYIHDLSFPHRVYCSSHSIEYIKKYGLRDLMNLNTTSKPAQSASVLTGHLNTFLASMQANYAGALGLGYINIFYAPYLVGKTPKELKQVAQELIFNGSQNAFSRGGQTLFLDFNIHTGVPSYLENVPAIGPGGFYMYKNSFGKVCNCIEEYKDGDWCLSIECNGHRYPVLKEHNGEQEFLEADSQDPALRGRVMTYGDFQAETQAFAHALLDIWYEGDARGHVFEFPKCDFHVSSETFTDPEQYKVYMHACKLASHNGSTYFVFDRDSASVASCCRLRISIADMSIFKHPEHLRTCGFQNVTINIPQAAYRAARNGNKTLEGVLKEIDTAMDLAVQAHLQKKEFVADIMRNPGDPLWQLGKTACDGRPYLDLKDCMYIIGIIGVNDAVQFITGKQMHESDEAIDMALKITGHMYLKTKEYTDTYGITFKLEESPAESAARKLAKSDLHYYRPEALTVYKGGDEDHAYYTNSIHLAADAPVDLIERIEKQAMFNSIIEAGAITHAFIGEQAPNPESIAELMRKAFLRTQSAQIVFSPEFTYCETCGHNARGLHPKCPKCGSTDVVGETRIVGYFSKIQSWNISKIAELRARERGNYNVLKS